jgi:hypothetical protein
MDMAVIHISEAEAGPDIQALIDHVREGDTVRIGSGLESFEVVRLPLSVRPRFISDVIAALEKRDSSASVDTSFAGDIEDGIRGHQSEPRFDPWA